jgi:hypothetical protein
MTPVSKHLARNPSLPARPFSAGACFGSGDQRTRDAYTERWPVNVCSTTVLVDPVRPKVSYQRRLHVMVNPSILSANYTIVAQSQDQVMVTENSPRVSMWPYRLNSAQTQRLSTISIYVDRGTSQGQLRLLYMNSSALSLWQEMGMAATIIGESHRPPHSATLAFGMPFSE